MIRNANSRPKAPGRTVDADPLEAAYGRLRSAVLGEHAVVPACKRCGCHLAKDNDRDLCSPCRAVWLTVIWLPAGGR